MKKKCMMQFLCVACSVFIGMGSSASVLAAETPQIDYLEEAEEEAEASNV